MIIFTWREREPDSIHDAIKHVPEIDRLVDEIIRADLPLFNRDGRLVTVDPTTGEIAMVTIRNAAEILGIATKRLVVMPDGKGRVDFVPLEFPLAAANGLPNQRTLIELIAKVLERAPKAE